MVELCLRIVPISLAQLDQLQDLLNPTDSYLSSFLNYKLLVATLLQVKYFISNYFMVVNKQIVDVLVVYLDVGQRDVEALLLNLILLNCFQFLNAVKKVLHCEN